MKAFTKIQGTSSQEIIDNAVARFNKSDYATSPDKVVIRFYGDGVDPVYMVESSMDSNELELIPFDNRFPSYKVENLQSGINVLVKDYRRDDDELPQITFCSGSRGLGQYLTTIDCHSYFLETILESISGSDTLMTIFKCAKKLGLEMHLTTGSIDGNVQQYMVDHKLKVDGEGMYLMDLASTIRRNEKVNISLWKEFNEQ